MPLLVLLDGPPGPDAPALATAVDLTGDRRPDACGHGRRMLQVLAAVAGQQGRAVALGHGTVLRADGTGDPETLARGLRWAARLRADVVAVPLGLSADHPDVRAAVVEVLASGAELVAAAGNPCAGQRSPLHPAALPGVVAVGAGDDRATYLQWDVPPDEVHDLPSSAAGSGTSGACVLAAWRRVVRATC